MSEVTKVGVIGAGNIFGAYAKASQTFPQFEIVAVADLDVVRAKAKAEEFSIAKGCSVDELLADEEIELVIGLAIPAAHGSLGVRVLEVFKQRCYCDIFPTCGKASRKIAWATGKAFSEPWPEFSTMTAIAIVGFL